MNWRGTRKPLAGLAFGGMLVAAACLLEYGLRRWTWVGWDQVHLWERASWWLRDEPFPGTGLSIGGVAPNSPLLLWLLGPLLRLRPDEGTPILISLVLALAASVWAVRRMGPWNTPAWLLLAWLQPLVLIGAAMGHDASLSFAPLTLLWWAAVAPSAGRPWSVALGSSLLGLLTALLHFASLPWVLGALCARALRNLQEDPDRRRALQTALLSAGVLLLGLALLLPTGTPTALWTSEGLSRNLGRLAPVISAIPRLHSDWFATAGLGAWLQAGLGLAAWAAALLWLGSPSRLLRSPLAWGLLAWLLIVGSRGDYVSGSNLMIAVWWGALELARRPAGLGARVVLAVNLALLLAAWLAVSSGPLSAWQAPRAGNWLQLGSPHDPPGWVVPSRLQRAALLDWLRESAIAEAHPVVQPSGAAVALLAETRWHTPFCPPAGERLLEEGRTSLFFRTPALPLIGNAYRAGSRVGDMQTIPVLARDLSGLRETRLPAGTLIECRRPLVAMSRFGLPQADPPPQTGCIPGCRTIAQGRGDWTETRICRLELEQILPLNPGTGRGWFSQRALLPDPAAAQATGTGNP